MRQNLRERRDISSITSVAFVREALGSDLAFDFFLEIGHSVRRSLVE